MTSTLTDPAEAAEGTKPRTMIVTGAAHGIGAGVTNALLDRGYYVVANSLNFANSALAPGEKLALVEGDIGGPSRL